VSVITTGGRSRGVALLLGWIGGSVAFGALYALAAYKVSPFAIPGLCLMVGVLVGAASRPAIGTAAVLVLIAISRWGPLAGQLNVLVAAITILIAVIVVVLPKVSAVSQPLPRLALPAVLFLLAAIASVPTSPDPSTARHLLRGIVTGVAIYFVTSRGTRDVRGVRTLMRGTSVTGLLVGGLATYQYLTGSGLASGFVTQSGSLVARVTAGFSQPNQLGGFLLVLAPLSLAGFLLDRRLRILHAAAFAITAAGIYVSFSRGSLIGLAVVPFIFLRGRQTLLLAPVIAALALSLTPNLLQERFATLTSGGSEIATRTDIWTTSVDIWSAHPLLGVGLGGFSTAYREARVPGKRYLPATVFEPPPHAHNLVLNQLAEEGIVGLLALLLLMAGGVRLALRLRAGATREQRLIGTAGLAALIAFNIHNLFDVTLQQTETTVVFWVVLGMLSGAAHSSRLPEVE
jgi:O-antigen ligase